MNNHATSTYTLRANDHLRPPLHVSELQRELMDWAVARENRSLDADPLHKAIYYLNEYRSILSRLEHLDSYLAERIDDLPLPTHKNFKSRI